MRFFIDTEFLEDGVSILPISIGIVNGMGEEYYAEVDLHPLSRARIEDHPWLMENVVPHLKGGEFLKPIDIIAAEIRYFCRPTPEFWAQCGAYDWVLLNQLYGSMVDHPNNWPYYCNDLQQYALHLGINRRKFPPQESVEHNALDDARWTRDTFLWLKTQEQARRSDGE